MEKDFFMVSRLKNPNRANLKHLLSKTGVLFSVLAVVMFIASNIIFSPIADLSQLSIQGDTQGCMGCDTDDDDGEVSVTPVMLNKNTLPSALSFLGFSSHDLIDGIQLAPDFPPKTTTFPNYPI